MPPDPNLPQKLRFSGWQRSPIYRLIADPMPHDGRLTGQLKLTLADDNSPDVGSGSITFHITAPHDIAGIKPSAIIRTAPGPLVRDVETTKLVHVDLREPDLPWRYTPQPAAGDTLRPWLIVLVGTAEEMKTEGTIVRVIQDAVFTAHNLNESYLWAHVQDDGAGGIAGRTARLLSPRQLQPQTEYLAALVPAFDEAGRLAWDLAAGRRPASLPVFHSWRFWTGAAGDFRTLAVAITPRHIEGLGRAPLAYRRGLVDAHLEVRGAITSLVPDADGPVEATARQDLSEFKDEVDALVDDEGLGRHVIGLPSYGRPWAEDLVATVWAASLNQDPRYRGTAGLGLWMGIESQQELVDAAAMQLGALFLAGHLVGSLAVGLVAARSLWNRRLPAEPERRTMLFAPLMRRMLAQNGTVMGHISGNDSPLDPCLFSSAARRMLRRGAAATRHTAKGYVGRAELLAEANACPPKPEKRLAGLPHVGALSSALGLPELEDEAVLRLRPLPKRLNEAIEPLVGWRIDFNNPEFVDRVWRLTQAIADEWQGCELHTMYLQRYRSEIATRPLLETAVRRCWPNDWEPRNEPPHPHDLHLDARDLRDFVAAHLPEPSRQRCNPPDLAHLADVVGKALDPNGETPPAWHRVQGRIHGINIGRLEPPELPIGLDFPTWALLRDRAKEWLLPGINMLPKDSVVAMQTNPNFIDGYLVGLNTQFMNEMHWRNMPVDRTSTPLRMFWGHINFETREREAEIQPLAKWDPATDLGHMNHQVLHPGDATGARDLVIVFRTDLFRRYPATLVYLVKPGPDVDADLKKTPDFDYTAAGRANRVFFGPIFQGTIQPDVVFFAFDIDPDDLPTVWLVLDEPPSELRFRSVDENSKPLPAIVDLQGVRTPGVVPDAMTFAQKTIDTPSRVAISGAYLAELGLGL